MAENALSQERNKTIDAAKGIGIFLVVFAHMNYVEPWQSVIYSFHIPLFFIIAGMTFQKDKYPDFWWFFKRRVQTLLIPYVVFALFSVLYRFVMDVAFNGISSTAYMNVGKHLLQFLTARYSQQMVANVALWFVPCLFLLECMYFWIMRISNRVLFFGTIVLLVCLGWFTESRYCPVDFSLLPWNFSSACFAVGFYAVGHLSGNNLSTFVSQNKTTRKKAITLAIAVLCFAVVMIVGKLNASVSIGSRRLGNGFLFYLTGILGFLGVFCVGEFLKNIKPLTFWGRSSFCIMATHLLIQKTILQAYQYFQQGDYKTTYFSWRKSLLIFVVVMAVSSILAVMYTHIRKVIRKRTSS